MREGAIIRGGGGIKALRDSVSGTVISDVESLSPVGKRGESSLTPMLGVDS